MGFLVLIFLGFYLVSVIVGRVVVAKVIAPQNDSFVKNVFLALTRAGFYTPTIAAGGHGIAVLPAIVAVLFTEKRYFLEMSALPVIVFTVSLIYSTINLKNT